MDYRKDYKNRTGKPVKTEHGKNCKWAYAEFLESQLEAKTKELSDKDKELEEVKGSVNFINCQIQYLENNCPWPKSSWKMNNEEYMKAVPDDKLRTSISGFLMRLGWENCLKEIQSSEEFSALNPTTKKERG